MLRTTALLFAALLLCAPALGDEIPGAKRLAEHPDKFWAKTETYELTDASIPEEPYIDASARKDAEIIRAFGGAAKPSVRLFLLHHGQPPKDAAGARSVLLVHGAAVQGTRSWGDNPYGGTGHGGGPRPGLASQLTELGFRVFAITFAHPHGDNDAQAEQIAAALARIRDLTGAKKVDVIAHSKGTIAARMYAGSVRAKRKRFTRYRKDIRRLILVAGPQGGIDISYAYPNLNYLVIAEEHNAPVIWPRAIVNYVWTDFGLRCMSTPGNAFRGQAQMLGRFDQIYGLITLEGQFDVESTYQGGSGKVSISHGIEAGLKLGGNLIARLERAGVDRNIEVAMLAGTHARIIGYFGERRGPSDGILLVRSALRSEAVTARGAKVIRRGTLSLNHLELSYEPQAARWIGEVLAKKD